MESCDSSAAGSLVHGEGGGSRTGCTDSEGTSLSGDGRGSGVDDLRGITDSAVAFGPPDADIVVLVSQVILCVELGL